MSSKNNKSKVAILIIDDEEVYCVSSLFDADGSLTSTRLEFDYSLHASLLAKGGGVKTLHFNDTEASILFSEVKEIFRRGDPTVFWLVFLDLQWTQAGAPSEEWETLRGEHSNGVNNNQKHGMVFAKYALSLDTWRGLICIATGNTNPNDADIETSTHSDQFLDKVLGDVRNPKSGPDRLKQGIEKFERLFGSRGLLQYWLSPPCGQPTWFLANSDYHNPRSNGCCQYKDLSQFFGASALWEEDNGKFTKRLFEIEKSALDANPTRPNVKLQNIKAGMVPLLFRNSIVLDGLNPDDEIPIPVQPGLPFLFAVKYALEKARQEFEEAALELKGCPLQLKKVDGIVIVALRQSKDASKLVTKVNGHGEGAEDDDVSGAIHRALHAKVIPPDELSDKKGCKVLGGTQKRIATVEWCSPEQELRISWPVTKEKENP